MNSKLSGDGNSNGKSNGNGKTLAEHLGNVSPQAGFSEDAEGTTLESGVASCRFSLKGGVLQQWSWRTISPRVANSPAGRHTQATALDLVNPAGGALVDHFMPLGTKPEDVVAGTYSDYGDFAEGDFRSQAVNTGGEVRIGLLRDGAIRVSRRAAEMRIAKSVALRPGAPDIAVLYRIVNSSLRPVQILFAVEFNLYAPGIYTQAAAKDGYYLIDGKRPEEGEELGSLGVSPGCTNLTLANGAGEMAVQIGWDRECDLWRMPSADGGPGVRLFSVWRIQVAPRDNWAMGLWLAPG